MSDKRSLSLQGDDTVPAKRLRLSVEPEELHKDDTENNHDGAVSPSAVESLVPTQHHLTRSAIQRSIALVLQHDCFDSATPEAMESFTALVETYIESFIEDTKTLAIAARREQPIPTDFEATLRRYNLSTSSLKPHLKHPIPPRRLAPNFVYMEDPDKDAHTALPLLGKELSGQADKEAKKYIPASFPDFPSKHTYMFTPQEDTSVRDPKKIREDAARTAQHGEEALRRLVRASKMRKQKEARLQVEGDSQGKERFRLWETAMKRLMSKEGQVQHANQDEVAEHSMIVNGDAPFVRKEISRLGKRSATRMGTAT